MTCVCSLIARIRAVHCVCENSKAVWFVWHSSRNCLIGGIGSAVSYLKVGRPIEKCVAKEGYVQFTQNSELAFPNILVSMTKLK